MERFDAMYYMDNGFDRIKTFGVFYETDEIELSHLVKYNRDVPFPFIDHVICVNNYMLYECKGEWGVIDNNQKLVLPHIFKHIYPSKLIDGKSYISDCLRQPNDRLFKNNNVDKKRYFVHQEIDRQRYNDNNPNHTIYEVTYNETEIVDYFIAEKDDMFIVFDVSNNKTSNMFDNSFYELIHYKKNIFFTRDRLGHYSIASIKNGRIKHELVSIKISGNNSYRDIIYGESIVAYKDGFIALKLLSGEYKWLIYKDVCGDNICDVRSVEQQTQVMSLEEELDAIVDDVWNNLIDLTPANEACIKQISSIALENPLFPTTINNVFILSFNNRAFIVKYEDSKAKLNKALSDDEREAFIQSLNNEKSNIAVDDYLHNVLSNCFNRISDVCKNIVEREDGLFDIESQQGWGLMNSDMSVVVKPRYSTPIEDYMNLMIVKKETYKGVVNNKDEEVIPCKYDYIQFGNSYIPVWLYNDNVYSDDYNDECDELNYYLDDHIKEIQAIPPSEEFSGLIVGITDKKNEAVCDVYLSGVGFLCSFSIKRYGGIFYDNKNNAVVFYEKSEYTEKGLRFFTGVTMFLISNKSLTPRYYQAYFIDDSHFLAISFGMKAGVVKINRNEIVEYETVNKNLLSIPTTVSWIVKGLFWQIHDEYSLITTPCDGLLYAIKPQEDSCIIDVYEVNKDFNKRCSYKVISDKVGLAHYEELCLNYLLSKGLINKDYDDVIDCFPFEKAWHNDETFCGRSNTYSREDSNSDAFDDVEGATWGILD